MGRARSPPGRLEPFVVGDPEDGRGRRRRDSIRPTPRRDGGMPRWPPTPTASRPRSRSSGAPTSASRACSTRCSARSGRSCRRFPGTTRDAIDTRLAWGRSEVVLIDTAGIRRRGKVASGPAAERYSTLRALHALSRADVAVLVIDAVEGLTSQDAHVAGYVVEEGKGLVIAVNKWDLVADKTDRTFDQYIEWIRNEVPFLDFAPIVSISAKTGPARRARAGDGHRHLGRATQADLDRRAQPDRDRGHRADAAAPGPRPPAEAVLRDPGRGRAADVRVLRLGCVGGPFQLPALPREPAARDVRLRRDADPARVPRPEPRSSCRAARRPEARRSPAGRGARRSAAAGRARKPR